MNDDATNEHTTVEENTWAAQANMDAKGGRSEQEGVDMYNKVTKAKRTLTDTRKRTRTRTWGTGWLTSIQILLI